MGCYGMVVTNDNGNRLLDFLPENNLFAADKVSSIPVDTSLLLLAGVKTGLQGDIARKRFQSTLR